MANCSTRRSATSAIILIAALALGAIPSFAGVATSGKQPAYGITSHSPSAVFQLALNKLSPKRLVAPKRVWRADLLAENSTGSPELVAVGSHFANAKAEPLRTGEQFRAPIRAPPIPSF